MNHWLHLFHYFSLSRVTTSPSSHWLEEKHILYRSPVQQKSTHEGKHPLTSSIFNLYSIFENGNKHLPHKYQLWPHGNWVPLTTSSNRTIFTFFILWIFEILRNPLTRQNCSPLYYLLKQNVTKDHKSLHHSFNHGPLFWPAQSDEGSH